MLESACMKEGVSHITCRAHRFFIVVVLFPDTIVYLAFYRSKITKEKPYQSKSLYVYKIYTYVNDYRIVSSLISIPLIGHGRTK